MGQDAWYIVFKSDQLRELLGSYNFYVGATWCPKLTVDYQKKAKKFVVQKRPLGFDEGAGSESKRLKVALDTQVAENKRMKEEVFKLRTSPIDGLLQEKMTNQTSEFAKREEELKSSIAVLEEDKKQKIKEKRAMRSLMEQAGLGNGKDLDELVEATVMSLEDEKGGEVEHSRKVAEGKEKELGEKKTKDGEEGAQSKEMAELCKKAEEIVALLLAGVSLAEAFKQIDHN